MDSLWKLLYLLEPAPLTLILTAVAVTFGSAFRALNYGKEMERNRDLSEASITLDRSQALMIPSFTRIQGLLLLACILMVAAWLVSGHWILNNLLGISICIAFVSHVRLPNIKICAMLLVCLFVYDIFWVFFSERFFGANVMVSVATQQASNPVHTVANSLSLPGLQLITKKLELPVKIVFPRNLLGGASPGGNSADFMMLGLGDMAIPAMLLALVLCFDHRKTRETVSLLDLHSSKGHKYIWYALPGYAVGLVTALAAGILTHLPQPALLYLVFCWPSVFQARAFATSIFYTQVPSTLGPVIFISWLRKDLVELWEGTMPNLSDKARQIEV
ncbi:hypothetical protein Gotur_031791 [Gossypium turneri]